MESEEPAMPVLTADLDTPYALAPEQVARYREQGFIKLKEVLSAETLAQYRGRFAELVAERAKSLPPLATRGTYGKAFQQIMNLWTVDEVAREFVFSKRLARIATELMGTRGVRMYHDQALYKEPGGGFTPWHADQSYWPLATHHCTTAWIPFQAVPVEMGPLQFAVGSHRADFGRGLFISDDSERIIARTLKDLPKVDSAFDLGEVSFHSGWTFHRAGGNATTRMREVMTIIYMDSEMRLSDAVKAKERQSDWNAWCPGAVPGEAIATKMNPLLYERTSDAR
jgi:ectoine hydroxylase-related dioxygenase (phytanoyl-CoA dioxygenase family)